MSTTWSYVLPDILQYIYKYWNWNISYCTTTPPACRPTPEGVSERWLLKTNSVKRGGNSKWNPTVMAGCSMIAGMRTTSTWMWLHHNLVLWGKRKQMKLKDLRLFLRLWLHPLEAIKSWAVYGGVGRYMSYRDWIEFYMLLQGLFQPVKDKMQGETLNTFQSWNGLVWKLSNISENISISHQKPRSVQKRAFADLIDSFQH